VKWVHPLLAAHDMMHVSNGLGVVPMSGKVCLTALDVCKHRNAEHDSHTCLSSLPLAISDRQQTLFNAATFVYSITWVM
jgi:hypothetical protein